MFLKFNNQDDTCENSYLRIISNTIEINLNNKNYQEIEFSQDGNGMMVLNVEIWTKSNLGRRGRIGFMKCLNDGEIDQDRIIPIRLIDTPRDIECKLVTDQVGSGGASENSSPNSSPVKSYSFSLSNDDGSCSAIDGASNQVEIKCSNKFIITLKNKSSLNIGNNELEHCVYGYFNIYDSRSTLSKLISTDYQLQIYIKNNGEKFTINSENTEILVLPNIRDQINDSISCAISILHTKSKKQLYSADIDFKIDPNSLKSFPKKYNIINHNQPNNNSKDILIISEKDKQKNLFEFKFDTNQFITLF